MNTAVEWTIEAIRAAVEKKADAERREMESVHPEWFREQPETDKQPGPEPEPGEQPDDCRAPDDEQPLDDGRNDGRFVKFDSRRVVECLYRNQVGDSELYRDLFKGRFIYDFAAGIWMIFTGHYWESDKRQSHMTATQEVVSIYKTECDRLSWKINGAKARAEPDTEINRLMALEKAVRQRMQSLQSKALLITSLFCHFLPSYDRHTGRNKMGKWLSISGKMLRITP